MRVVLSNLKKTATYDRQDWLDLNIAYIPISIVANNKTSLVFKWLSPVTMQWSHV